MNSPNRSPVDAPGDVDREPLVSVCIGVYNRERYIRECIDSVLAQTYRNFEVIVVDDASTDRSVDILKSYGNAIALIERRINSGNCAVARNQAMRKSSGQYIAFLDSDDSWSMTKLEKQVRFMGDNPGLALSYTYCQLVDQDSKPCGIRHQGRLRPEGDAFDWLMDQCWITTSTVMFKRSILDDVGMMTENSDFRIGEDWEYFIRIAKNNAIGLLDDVLTNYRKSEAGISITNWRHMPRSVFTRILILQNKDYWAGRISKRAIVDKLVAACHESSVYWRGRGFYDRARWFDRIWLRYRPFDLKAWLEFGKALYVRSRKEPRV